MMAAPPCSMEAEQSLLGAILINNDAYGVAIRYVDAADFFEPLHQRIFAEAGRLITAGRVATPVTVKEAFPNLRIGDDVNAPTINQYLARLCAEATTIINAPDYARTIRELAMMREIIAVGEELRRTPANSDVSVRMAFERLDSLRADLHRGDDERASLGRLADELVRNAEDVRKDVPSTVPSTGFTDLDRQLGGGLRPGRLFVIAGRPGVGKTVIGAALARRVAKRGYGVAIHSLEIDGAEMSARIVADEIANESYAPFVAYRDVLTGKMDDQQRRAVERAAERLRDLTLEIDATGDLMISEITARMRIVLDRWRKRDIQPGAVIIDYLGLVKTTGRYEGRKVDEIGEAARDAKNMAKRLGICVVMLCQLNRAVESRDEKRPEMRDLRDSGHIEEHADVVGLLYRHGYYDELDPQVRRSDPAALERMESRRHDLEMQLGKNRLGPRAIVRFWCDVARSAVDDPRIDYGGPTYGGHDHGGIEDE